MVRGRVYSGKPGSDSLGDCQDGAEIEIVGEDGESICSAMLQDDRVGRSRIADKRPVPGVSTFLSAEAAGPVVLLTPGPDQWLT
jgi:hypothetical protein